MRVHQHHFGLGLSRRRPAGGQLLHGAPDRLCRGRARHRPHRAAQRNIIRAKEIPFKAASGMTYDSGDFPGLFKEALARADVEGLQPAQAREQEAQASCAASASAATSKSPPPATRRWAASASTPTAASPSSPARSITARATPPPSRRCLTEKLGVPFERIKLVAGRQRRPGHRRRHRRLALDDAFRHRHRRRRPTK